MGVQQLAAEKMQVVVEEEEEEEECKGAVPCKVAARRLWRAAFEDAHSCLPKALPKTIAGVEMAGAFQTGSFRTFHYHPSYSKRVSKENNLEHLVRKTKEKLLKVDHDAMKLKCEVVEGGYIGVIVEYYTITIHIKEGDLPDNCIVHWNSKYKALSSRHRALMRARLKEIVPLSIKGVESYLISNDEYHD